MRHFPIRKKFRRRVCYGRHAPDWIGGERGAMAGTACDGSSGEAPAASTGVPAPVGVCEAFRSAKRPILVTHVFPDGDAMGSQLALARAFRSRGAVPRVLVTQPAPFLQEFLDLRGDVEVVLGGRLSDEQREAFDRADGIWVLDTNDPRRLGELEAPVFGTSAPKIVIDHHLTDDLSAFDLAWCDPTSPATGVLIEALLRAEGVAIDREIAEPLFVALATDTGWFRFSNASYEAFEVASRLVRAGVEPDSLHSALFENSSLARTQALGRMLSELEADPTGRIVYSVVRAGELARFGVTTEDVDGFIDSLKAVRGAEILILFVEVSGGSYKVSLRSKGAFDVHRLAHDFGGGGHAKASGFRIEAASLSEFEESRCDAPKDEVSDRHSPIVKRVLAAAQTLLSSEPDLG